MQKKYIGVEGIRTQTLEISPLPSKVLRLDRRKALRPIIWSAGAEPALPLTSPPILIALISQSYRAQDRQLN